MNANVSIDFKSIGKGVAHFFERFHAILFFLLVSCSLIGCIAVVLAIITLSGEAAESDGDRVNQTFDQKTIERLGELRSKDQGGSLTLPEGRVNPFAE